MRVAIIGSEDLFIKEDDVSKYVKNCIYPHPLDFIITTNADGVAETARDIAKTNNIHLEVVEDIYDAVDLCEMAVILHYSDEIKWVGRYCVKKGRLFKEYKIDRK